MLSFRKFSSDDFLTYKTLALYRIAEDCDPSLKSLTTDPLRLVSCLDVIRRFVLHRSEFHYGLGVIDFNFEIDYF